MSDAIGDQPPEGFVPMQRNGVFWRVSGPYFERVRENGAEQVGSSELRAEEP